MAKITPFKLNRNTNSQGRRHDEVAPSTTDRIARLRATLDEVERFAQNQGQLEEVPPFMAFETALKEKVDAVGRAATELFLTGASQRVSAAVQGGVVVAGRLMRPSRRPQARNLTGQYGVVRYFRDYLRTRREERRRGFHPLDVALGLTGDRFSWSVLSVAARLATKVSYAEAQEIVGTFLPNAPSTEVIEQTVLGLGQHSTRWFESLAAPKDDGDVLVVMIDSKGAPTATDTELARRRGKRRRRAAAPSPRHRGRQRRGLYPKKERRKKGDKSKNAKMATLVLMYTLRRSGRHLLGPINRWVYASFAPKEHAFQVARREADKRGFTPGSGRVVQLVTDGDPDLSCYAKRYFSEAVHTIDVMHVIEKLWTAGECIHAEGSKALTKWVHCQRKRLYAGHADKIVAALRQHLAATPRTGPGNKGKRERLEDVIRYIDRRLGQMNYDELLRQDLEIGSGPVEGAVKYVLAKRCDHGGMRWIKERVEALVQLRCIEINGQWDAFVASAHDRLREKASATGLVIRLQTQNPAPLPAVIETWSTSQTAIAEAA